MVKANFNNNNNINNNNKVKTMLQIFVGNNNHL